MLYSERGDHFHSPIHCTDTAPASSPFLTLLGGAFLSFGPVFFTFCVAFIDGHNTRQRQMSEILDIHLYIDNIAINIPKFTSATTFMVVAIFGAKKYNDILIFG